MSVGINNRDYQPRKPYHKPPKPYANTDNKTDSPPKPRPIISAFCFQDFFHPIHASVHRLKSSIHNARQLIARRLVHHRHMVQQVSVRYRIMRRGIRLLLLLTFLLLPLHVLAHILFFVPSADTFILPHPVHQCQSAAEAPRVASSASQSGISSLSVGSSTSMFSAPARLVAIEIHSATS